MHFKQPNIIRIIGNIGSGKSTLLNFLKKERPDYFILDEPVETNPLLDLYYKEPEKWGMHLQVFMEDAYYQGLQESKKDNILTDFGLTRVFTQTLHKQGFLDTKRFEMLKIISNKYEVSLPKPIYFYIMTEPKICLKRIKSRGRICEQNIKLDYLKDLDFFYKEFIENQKNPSRHVLNISVNFKYSRILEYLEIIESDRIKK